MTAGNEVGELGLGFLLGGRNPVRMVKAFRSEGAIDSELFENLQENWADLNRIGVSAGRVYLYGADQQWKLFHPMGENL